MERAKKDWKILQKLENDFANRVRSFMVIGRDGEGVIVATEDGLGYWLGTMKFSFSEKKIEPKPTLLDVPGRLVQMAQGNSHILLLYKRGEIYTMGKNHLGQLGLGTVDGKIYFKPQLISIPQHRFTSVRGGDWHSLALTEDGKVWAWGKNDFGQIGLSSSNVPFPSPRQILELNQYRVVAVQCGGRHSLALTNQGEVYAWGWNKWGQFGDGSGLSRHIPTRIPTPSPVRSIAAGYYHTLLLTRDGEVHVCGSNKSGQLGLPTLVTKFRFRLVKVEGLPLISKIASHPLSYLSIAMSSNQRCFVWGGKRDGTFISTPRELFSDNSTVESLLSYSSRNTPHSVSIPEVPPSPLSTRMSRMFDNPETSPDVQFVVEKWTIHAHRIILSNSSDYFTQIFSQRLLLLQVNPEDLIIRVTIPDHSYPVFHAFLRFLYTDYLEVHHDLLLELFELASLYHVLDLQQVCILRMRTTLTPATCCLYYQLTYRHSLPELEDFQQELVKFISSKFLEVLSTDAFQSMDAKLCKKLTLSMVNHSPKTIAVNFF